MRERDALHIAIRMAEGRTALALARKLLLHSETATRLGIDNTPPDRHADKEYILTRILLVYVKAGYYNTSGYRSAELTKAVRAARAKTGAPVATKPSRHGALEALDFRPKRTNDPYIVAPSRKIFEGDHVHLEWDGALLRRVSLLLTTPTHGPEG